MRMAISEWPPSSRKLSWAPTRSRFSTSPQICAMATSVGVRGSFSPNFEATLKANYTDGSDFDGDFSGTVGAQYKFTQTWGVVGEAEFGDGGEAYLVGLRASF